jgi:hypothetical protein
MEDIRIVINHPFEDFTRWLRIELQKPPRLGPFEGFPTVYFRREAVSFFVGIDEEEYQIVNRNDNAPLLGFHTRRLSSSHCEFRISSWLPYPPGDRFETFVKDIQYLWGGSSNAPSVCSAATKGVAAPTSAPKKRRPRPLSESQRKRAERAAAMQADHRSWSEIEQACADEEHNPTPRTTLLDWIKRLPQ